MFGFGVEKCALIEWRLYRSRSLGCAMYDFDCEKRLTSNQPL